MPKPHRRTPRNKKEPRLLQKSDHRSQTVRPETRRFPKTGLDLPRGFYFQLLLNAMREGRLGKDDALVMFSSVLDVLNALALALDAADKDGISRIREASLTVYDEHLPDLGIGAVLDIDRSARPWNDIAEGMIGAVSDDVHEIPESERPHDKENEIIARECAKAVGCFRVDSIDGCTPEELIATGLACLRKSRAPDIDGKVRVVIAQLLKKKILVSSTPRVAMHRKATRAEAAQRAVEERLREGAATTPQLARDELARMAVETARKYMRRDLDPRLSDEECVQRVIARWGTRELNPSRRAKLAILALIYNGDEANKP